MATITVNKIAGLHTSPNETGSVPEGALVQADNCVIRNKDVIEPRRGQANQSYAPASSVNEIFFYNGTALVQYGTSLARDTGSAYSAYSGTYTPPDTSLLRMKGAEAQQSFYFTTTTGIKVLDSTTATPATAGVSPATNIVSPAVSTSGTGQWMAQNTKATYRCVWGKKDANGRVLLGRPSGRTDITNSGATAWVYGQVPAPADITASHFYRVYRTESVSTSVSNTLEDSYLVYENTGAAGYTAAIGSITNLHPTTSLQFDKANHGYRVGMKILFTKGATETGDFMTGVYEIVSATTNSFFVDYGAATAPGTNSATATVQPWSFQFKDYCPDEMLGDPLYTNSSDGEGDANANEQPPIAKDIALWNERLWFANTTGKHRYTLSMLGVGTPDGVQDGDVISIGGQSYVGEVTAPVVNDTQFLITGTSTSAINIDATARDLVRAINQNPRNSTLRAYYVSGLNDVPGKILIEAVDLGASTLYVGASRQESWNPYPPKVLEITEGSSSRTSNVVTITTTADHKFAVGDSVYLTSDTADANFAVGVKTVASTPSTTTFTYAETGSNATMTGTYRVFKATATSSADAAPHRIYYSKYQQPEAVPLLQYVEVGSKNKAILRIVPLRDKLYVFKEDGIYVISGEAPFRVDLLDDTIKLFAPDTAVTVGNQIFCLTYQGVAAVSDAGVRIVSRPIENDILRTALSSTNIANAKLYSFGVSYESERSYILGLASTGAAISEHYVYNYLTNTWTKWTPSRRCGRVHPSTDVLYMPRGDTTYVAVERKAMTRADYRDFSYAVNVDSVNVSSSTTFDLTLDTTYGDLTVGDFIEGSGWTALVTSTGAGQFPAVLVTSGTPTTGAATISKCIDCQVAFAANVGGSPSLSKQVREVAMLFKRRLLYRSYATVATDLQSTAGNVELTWTGRTISTSGSLTTRALPVNIRAIVPHAQQKSTYHQIGFSCAEAYAFWELNGYAAEVEGLSERGTR